MMRGLTDYILCIAKFMITDGVGSVGVLAPARDIDRQQGLMRV
jgi:hypothetical protein